MTTILGSAALAIAGMCAILYAMVNYIEDRLSDLEKQLDKILKAVQENKGGDTTDR